MVRTGGLFGLGDNDSVRLQAVAVAVAEKDSVPLALFSVDAQLLDLNAGGLLPRLLTAAGVNVSGMTVLDSHSEGAKDRRAIVPTLRLFGISIASLPEEGGNLIIRGETTVTL